VSRGTAGFPGLFERDFSRYRFGFLARVTGRRMKAVVFDDSFVRKSFSRLKMVAVIASL
jgi:hypothetical protein